MSTAPRTSHMFMIPAEYADYNKSIIEAATPLKTSFDIGLIASNNLADYVKLITTLAENTNNTTPLLIIVIDARQAVEPALTATLCRRGEDDLVNRRGRLPGTGHSLSVCPRAYCRTIQADVVRVRPRSFIFSALVINAKEAAQTVKWFGDEINAHESQMTFAEGTDGYKAVVNYLLKNRIEHVFPKREGNFVPRTYTRRYTPIDGKLRSIVNFELKFSIPMRYDAQHTWNPPQQPKDRIKSRIAYVSVKCAATNNTFGGHISTTAGRITDNMSCYWFNMIAAILVSEIPCLYPCYVKVQVLVNAPVYQPLLQNLGAAPVLHTNLFINMLMFAASRGHLTGVLADTIYSRPGYDTTIPHEYSPFMVLGEMHKMGLNLLPLSAKAYNSILRDSCITGTIFVPNDAAPFLSNLPASIKKNIIYVKNIKEIVCILL